MKTWFITGCSTGFGRLLAERAYAMGDNVVATARSAQSLGDLCDSDDRKILRLPLDVLDRSQIDAGVAAARERFGEIDVLVNNAGYGYFATQEEGELEEVRRMFETNVFGLISMTQAVLPRMRERRSGTIVNLSSISGRIATPRGGFYQSSKWAVEALSESLYLEVSGFGIRVLVIEPGSYDTDFSTRSARVAPGEKDPKSPYAELRERWKGNATRKIFTSHQDPVEVIDAIIDAVHSDLRFVRLPVGVDATSLLQRRARARGGEFVEWMRETYYE
jgi:NADP-dependent 3-hydroxy acid dehydrogenase YdfG